MFNEYELLDRYDAAARAGFKGVEIQAPYSEPVAAIQERLERYSLEHVIINLAVADPVTGLKQSAVESRHGRHVSRTRGSGRRVCFGPRVCRRQHRRRACARRLRTAKSRIEPTSTILGTRRPNLRTSVSKLWWNPSTPGTNQDF